MWISIVGRLKCTIFSDAGLLELKSLLRRIADKSRS